MQEALLLLNKNNSFAIHHQNIQSLATETYKTLNNLPGGIFEGLFTLRTDSYSLCLEQKSIFPKLSTVLKGIIHVDILVALYGIQFQVIPGTLNHTTNFILKLNRIVNVDYAKTIYKA